MERKANGAEGMRRALWASLAASLLAGCGSSEPPATSSPVPRKTGAATGTKSSDMIVPSPPLEWLHSMTSVYRRHGTPTLAEEMNQDAQVIKVRSAYRKRFGGDAPFDDRSVDRIIDWLVEDQGVTPEEANKMTLIEVARRLEKGK